MATEMTTATTTTTEKSLTKLETSECPSPKRGRNSSNWFSTLGAAAPEICKWPRQLFSFSAKACHILTKLQAQQWWLKSTTQTRATPFSLPRALLIYFLVCLVGWAVRLMTPFYLSFETYGMGLFCYILYILYIYICTYVKVKDINLRCNPLEIRLHS